MGSLMKKLVIFVTIFSIFPPDEEDGSVVAHDVPVALLSVVLDSETPWIAGCVG